MKRRSREYEKRILTKTTTTTTHDDDDHDHSFFHLWCTSANEILWYTIGIFREDDRVKKKKVSTFHSSLTQYYHHITQSKA